MVELYTLSLIALGERFREERSQWSDHELLYLLDIAPSTLAQIESGKVSPAAVHLFQMARCGLDIQYILTGVRSTNSHDVAAAINSFAEVEKAAEDERLSRRIIVRRLRQAQRSMTPGLAGNLMGAFREADRAEQTPE